MADGSCLVCMWTSEKKLHDWLARRDNPSEHFEIETRLAFIGLSNLPQVRYVLVDPGPEDDPSADSFALNSFPPDRKIDLHSKQFEKEREAFTYQEISGKSLSELRANGVFESYWSGLQEALPDAYFPAWRKQLIREIWEAHPDLSSAAANKYFLGLDNRTVGDLQTTGDFACVWRSVEAWFRELGFADEVLKRAREVVIATDHVTYQQVVEGLLAGVRTMRGLVKTMRDLPAHVQEAFLAASLEASLLFPPPSECRACGERVWDYESLSPNKRSATWKCGYCRKMIVVREDDVRRRAVSVNREPIPKEVQREVWQRDGGKCVVCGSQERLEFDHIIPHSKGGANTARNLQLLCEDCNRKKTDNNPGEY
jgi:5-methylcytosine-specific restriction endonuclease McrA